jgi:DNA-binding LacI/PurR family transcriptional regulator
MNIPPVTLPKYSEIAQRAKVSTMTVSNVLRGRPGVGVGKREQVFQVLQEFGVDVASLGVVSNGKSIGGRKRRSKSFLLVEAGWTSGQLHAPVFMDLIRGIEEGCVAAGRSMQVAYTKNTAELTEAADSFHGEGVILFGPTANASVFRSVDAGLAIVRAMGDPDPSELVDHVAYDNEAVGLLAADWLMAKGSQRPAFIGGLRRGPAFESRCAAAGITPVMTVVGGDLYKIAGEHQTIDHSVLRQCVDQALEAGADSFFVYSDQLSVALYGQLQQRGLQPMVDFPVVGCNHEQGYLSLLDPRPATVDIHAREIGRRTVSRLVSRIKDPQACFDSLRLMPSLVCESHGRPQTKQPQNGKLTEA